MKKEVMFMMESMRKILKNYKIHLVAISLKSNALEP